MRGTTAFALIGISACEDSGEIHEYATALCAQTFACGCDHGYASEETCVDDVVESEDATLEEFEAQGYTVDRDCLDGPYIVATERVEHLGCDAYVYAAVALWNVVPRCVYREDKSVDDECSEDQDCGREQVCGSSFTGTSACVWASSNGARCRSSLECDIRSNCIKGICTEHALGEACNYSCPWGSWCDAWTSEPGICVPDVALGGACKGSGTCVSGAFCDAVSDTCRPVLGHGDACAMDEDPACSGRCFYGTCQNSPKICAGDGD